MSPLPHRTPAPTKSALSSSRWERAALGLLMLAIVAFYAWTVKTTVTHLPPVRGDEGDYYNLLSRGFLDGQLSMKVEVSPALLNAEDPYDPAKRPPGAGMHDATYFKGKYYLYFGAAPVVALYTPFRLLVGRDLPMPYGNWLFASLGFLAASGFWLSVRRRFFPESRFWVALAGVAILGCCGMVFSVLRRPSIWELPIASGYAFAMLALAFTWAGLVLRGRSLWWALAGLSLGMAVGSRPVYVAGSVLVVVVPLCLWWSTRAASGWRWWPRAPWWRDTLAFGLSYSAVIAAILFYNYQRFGNPAEFGLNYQLTSSVESKVTHFSPRFIPFNSYIYYLAPAQWGRYFPFIQFIRPPQSPTGYYGFEYPYGLLANMPVLLLALVWPLGLLRRCRMSRHVLASMGVGLTCFYLAMALMLVGFLTGAQRYMVDFAPSLALLSVLGLLGLERALHTLAPVLRRLLLATAAAAAVASVFFGLMTGFQLHGLLKTMSPGSYARLAGVFNVPSHLWERLTGFRHGPLELRLRFPQGKAGQLEPLVSTGWEFYSDHVFVHYLDEGHVRLGFDHTSHRTLWSAPLEIDFAAEHLVRVEMGSLYPPREHPLFAGKTDAELGSILRWCRLTLNGRTAVESTQTFYEASPESVRIGGVDYTRAYGEKFTGQILEVRRGDYSVASQPRNPYGPVSLTVLFPQAVGRVQPLLATGAPGRADTLYVRYVAEGVARLGYDHWGYGALESQDFAIRTDVVHQLQIRMPSLMPKRPELEDAGVSPGLLVLLDGQIIWATAAGSHPCHPDEVYIAHNGVGSSVCEQEFGGLVTAITREADEPAPALKKADRVRLRFAVNQVGAPGTFEPLVARGVTGAADLLLLEYLDGKAIRLAVDHWGTGLRRSEPIAIDRYAIQDLHVQFKEPDRVVVDLNGQRVWEVEVPLYPADPSTLTLGANKVGASTAAPLFSGVLLSGSFPEDDQTR